MGNYSSEVDCATLDLPVAKTGGIRATASTDLGRHLKRCFLPTPLVGLSKCAFGSRAQFTRLFLVTDFGFTIF